MRRTLAALTVLALPGPCGEDQPVRATDTTSDAPEVATSDLDDVEVSGGPGEEPTLEFEAPFGVTDTAQRVVDEGEGGPADGSVFDSSWDRAAPASFPIGTGGVIAG